MDKTLIDRLNREFDGKPLFYVTSDPERALGLESVINNYHIVCIDHTDIVDYLEKSGVKVFCLEKELGKKNTIFRNSAKLLDHELTKKYIESNSSGSGYFITFKVSKRFEQIARNYNFKILNTSPELNKSFEEKLSQYELLSKNTINFPKTKIIKLKDSDFDNLNIELGKGFVLQFNKGHTGSGTVFIDENEELETLKDKFPDRLARFSKKINGEAYTLNAVVAKKEVLTAGLSYQITGVEELTKKEGGTVGNDFSFIENLSLGVRKAILIETKKIGNKMRESGYLGLFGVDFVVRNKEVFVIEINARQPASVSFFNQIQLEKNETPLSIYHLALFLEIDFEVDSENYSRENTKSVEFSQIFLRNNSEGDFLVKGPVKSGIYRLQSDNSAFNFDKKTIKNDVLLVDESGDKPLILKEKTYSLFKSREKGLLVLVQGENKEIREGGELGRIQAPQSVVDEKGRPLTWAIESLLTLKEYLS